MTINTRTVGAVFVLGLTTHSAFSQVTLYQEQGQLVRAPRALGSLGDTVMGDEINFSTGTISFTHLDVSLPGNNALPMAVSRSFTAGAEINTIGHFGHWELEIPHMMGMFAANSGWVSGTAPNYSSQNQRCTYFGLPPGSVGSAGSNSSWDPTEFWHGNFLVAPGAGSQEVLRRNPANTNVPQDGHSWPLVTKNLWALRCVPIASPGDGKEGGEGFLAVDSNGTQYRFDWLATRGTKAIRKANGLPQGVTAVPPVKGGAGATPAAGIPTDPNDDPDQVQGAFLNRTEVWLMPTVITDKFGNTVRYTWDTTDKWKLLRMDASDGRQLIFTYVPNTHMIASVSDGTRTWQYHYQAAPDPAATYPTPILSDVINPDNSSWQLAGIDALATNVRHLRQPTCNDPGTLNSYPVSGSMTHPSGAVGTFNLTPTLHGRTKAPENCIVVSNTTTYQEYAETPRYFDTYSVTSKTLSGPGLPSMTWQMAYSPASANWEPCTDNCSALLYNTTLVTDPKGDVTRYVFGNRYNIDEGLLLQTDIGWNGSSALRTTLQHYRDANAGPYANPAGYSDQPRGDSLMSAKWMPQDRRETTQQGVSFVWQADATSFDAMARPHFATKASSLGFTRTEHTYISDLTAKWVLGLTTRATTLVNGAEIESEAHSYDQDNGNLLTSSHFGHLDETRTYYADGTLHTKADGLNHTTTFSNYKLGLAQNVTYADNSSESASVNQLGFITATTDAAGFTTTYGYDNGWRLNLIRYPAGDNVTWNDTTILTEQVGSDEYGIGAGHWKQTVATGDGVSVSYLDAFWRPVLSRTFDAGSGAESVTSKMVLRQFDHKGKTTFESYPQRFIGSINGTLPGTTTVYDALSRPVQTLADSEQGQLKTGIDYLSGFQKRITNPRNKVSTSGFQVFDEPDESALISMAAPEGVNLSIARDIFGKPTAMTRSGSYAGQTVSNTRQFVYDAYHRLCKSIEPEIGVMKQKWDDANNILWRVSGTTGASDQCGDEYATAAEKTSFTYDPLNRVRSTSFGDGSPAITRTYTPDGLPETVASNGMTWTTTYNHRRLPILESLSVDGNSYNLGYHYNVNGHLDQLSYPNSLALDYAPNALGEATKVGSFASGIAYYPNGAIASFKYGNGVVHNLTLNARNLPGQANDIGVLNDLYSYDENGNVTGISDQQQNITNRSMSFDGLDRMVSANAPNLWGLGTYTYDALDNLRTSAIGSRNSTHNYDLSGSNRLQNIVSNGVTTSYGYDVQGNITARGAQGFTFDRGNRMSAATGKGTYLYDGLGHRTKILSSDGSKRLQLYSPAGQLLFGTQTSPDGKTTTSSNYIYLHHGMIAEVAQ